jgi:hypothetical protein
MYFKKTKLLYSVKNIYFIPYNQITHITACYPVIITRIDTVHYLEWVIGQRYHFVDTIHLQVEMYGGRGVQLG